MKRLEEVRVKSSSANELFPEERVVRGGRIAESRPNSKRPELRYEDIETLEGSPSSLPVSVREQVEIQCKYEGYLKRQETEIKKFRHIEKIAIPGTSTMG